MCTSNHPCAFAQYLHIVRLSIQPPLVLSHTCIRTRHTTHTHTHICTSIYEYTLLAFLLFQVFSDLQDSLVELEAALDACEALHRLAPPE